MKQNALVISAFGALNVEALEKALLASGFATVRVKTLKEAGYRLENEVFSVLLCEDSGEPHFQETLMNHLKWFPFGVTTPIVLLGPEEGPGSKAALTSILDQYFPYSTDAELVADFASETHNLRREKVKRGKLGFISVPQLLYQASEFRYSGALVVESGDEKCIIYMERGFVVFASSNRDENRFGDFLVRQGIISKEQHLHAVRLLRKGNRRFGRILVDEGYLKPQVLGTLIQSQVKHIVLNVFDWSLGEFYVVFDELSNQGDSVAHFEVPHLVMEGVQLKFDEKKLNDVFSPFDSKISLTMPLNQIQKRIKLKKNEIDFLRLVGSGRAIGDLLHLNSFSRLQSLRLLYSFHVLRLLTVERGAVSPAEVAPSKEERAKVVQELFGKPSLPHSAPMIARKPLIEKPTSFRRRQPVAKHSRFWALAYMMAGTIAFSAVLTLTTIFETRMSREGQSNETRMAVLERDPELHVLESPQVPNTPRSVLSPPNEVSPPDAEPKAMMTPVEVLPMSELGDKPDSRPTKAPAAKPLPRLRDETKVARTPPQPKPKPKPKTDISALLRRARQYRVGGQLEQSLMTLRHAERLHPTHPAVAMQLADTLFDMDRLEDAERAYWKATGLSPQHPSPYLGLGTIALLRNDTTGAKRFYKRYLSLLAPRERFRPRVLEVRKILENLEAR